MDSDRPNQLRVESLPVGPVILLAIEFVSLILCISTGYTLSHVPLATNVVLSSLPRPCPVLGYVGPRSQLPTSGGSVVRTSDSQSR